jgi:hypothetical protein
VFRYDLGNARPLLTCVPGTIVPLSKQ